MYKNFGDDEIPSSMLSIFFRFGFTKRLYALDLKILVIAFTFFRFDCVGCYKILGLFPYPGKSHDIVFDALLVELARRGHHVTNYNTFPKINRPPNYHEVSIKHCFSLPNVVFNLDEMKKIGNTPFEFSKRMLRLAPKYHEIKNCAPLIELWNSEEKFDLMITETFTNEFFQLFAHKLKIPVLKFRSNMPLPWMADQLALPDNPSYAPIPYSGFTDKMDFFQRCENFLVYLYLRFQYSKWETMYDDMAAKIFRSAVPPLKEIVKNTNAIFFFTHFTINQPRPLTPNAVEVAGLHISEPKVLCQVSVNFFS